MPEEHQALPVEGYKAQSQSNIDLVNANKRKEEEILQTLDGLAQSMDIDKRWLAIGRTHIEEGFMAINRSIFKPGRVSLNDPTEEKPRS